MRKARSFKLGCLTVYQLPVINLSLMHPAGKSDRGRSEDGALGEPGDMGGLSDVIPFEFQILGFLSILQRAAPLFEKARSFRLIEIGEQFCTNMDRFDGVAAIRRYDTFCTEAEAHRTDRPGQEKLLTAFRKQVIEEQFRGFWVRRGDRYEGYARHQRDVVGRKHYSDRGIFLGPFDRVRPYHIVGNQMFAG